MENKKVYPVSEGGAAEQADAGRKPHNTKARERSI